MKARKIKTKLDLGDHTTEFSRWYDGKGTYLWIGSNNKCIGTLSGHKLYRLAKTIVNEFENK